MRYVLLRQRAVGEAEGCGVIVEAFEEDVGKRVGFVKGISEEGQGLFDEQGTGAGCLAATDDEQTAAGTGESDVEQVEVVDSVLQVFVAVIGLEDSAHHLLLAVVDGYNREVIEGGLCWLAPKDVARLLF